MVATDFLFVMLFYRLIALYGGQVLSTAGKLQYRAASQNICQYWRNIAITLLPRSEAGRPLPLSN
jgi:hypothetical protein